MEDNHSQTLEDVLEINQTIDPEEDLHTNVSEGDQDVVEEISYTQADIDALQAKIAELLQDKPKELTEEEIKIQQKLEQVWQREVKQTLKEEGVEIFADFIKADVDDTETLQNQITKLKEIVGSLELSSGYQPSNHKTVDSWSIAKKNKDVNAMIKNKLNL